MKNRFMKMKAWLLAVSMVAGTLYPSMPVQAVQNSASNSSQDTAFEDRVVVDTDDFYVREDKNVAFVMEVNDLYADELSVDDLCQVDPEREIISEDGTVTQTQPTFNAYTEDGITYYDSKEEAAEALRTAMINRSTTVGIGFPTSSNDYAAEFKEVLNKAKEHTGVSVEGDYISYQYGGLGYSVMGGDGEFGYKLKITYYTTQEQETKMNAKVAAIMKELDLDGKSDYEKMKAIYGYVTSHVTYDYTNLNDNTHLLKYTAYAAAIDGTAVCQGYANFLYRLSLEAGVDNRIVISQSMCHAWNIVRMGNVYYQADSTWDAGYAFEKYTYFLQGSLYKHEMPDQYGDDAFSAKYPLGTGAYTEGSYTDISKYTLTLSNDNYVYDGSEKKPAVTVKNGSTVFSADNYDVQYSNNIKAGTATVKVTGKGEYAGSISKNFTIAALTLSGNVVSDCDCGVYQYTGKPYKPTIKLTYKGTELKEGVDYTLEYKNNTNAGSASISIQGIGNFTGSLSESFTISAVSLKSVTVNCNCAEYQYTGSAIQPEVTLTYSGNTLVRDKDYTITYTNNVNVGEATITITGKGNFVDTLTEHFTISESAPETSNNLVYTFDTIDGGTVSSAAENGKPKLMIFYKNTCWNCQNIMSNLLKDKDFSGLDVVTVNFQGIDAAKEEAATVGQNGMIFAYDSGSALWAYAKAFNLKNAEGYVITPVIVYVNANNTVVYSTSGNDNDIVSHIKTYLGVDVEKRVAKDIANCNITLSQTTYTYDGKAKTPTVTVKDGTTTLTVDKDYTLTYSDNIDAGSASVAVVGKGEYKGRVIKTFTIVSASTEENVPSVENGYYMLKNEADLFWFANQVNSGNSTINAKLVGDITVTKAWTPIGTCTGHTTGHHYAGTFDGGGHTISGLKVTDEFYAGLFGGLKSNAVVKNVGVINSTISGTKAAGAIVGGTTTDSNTVIVSGCFSENNTITATYASGSNAGGIAGGIWNSKGYIENCYAAENTSVKATGSSSDFAGGLVGYITATKIENSFSQATVQGTTTGSLAGKYESTLVNCYSGADTRFASGEIGYLLNTKSAGTVWYQKIGTDSYPKLVSKGKDVIYGISGYKHGESELSAYVANSPISGVKLHAQADSVKKHDLRLDEGTVVKAPSATEEGIMLYSCQDCSYTVTKPIDKISEEIDFTKCVIEPIQTQYTYTGNIIAPKVKVTYNSVILTENVDYKVESSSIDANDAAPYQVVGLGKYKGSVNKTFVIAPKNLQGMSLTLAQYSYKYTGSAITPAATLVDGRRTLAQGKDYSIQYSNNTNVTEQAKVTATGMGNYTGSISVNFSISQEDKTDIANLDMGFNLEGDDEYYYTTLEYIYTGSAIIPDIYIYDSEADEELYEGYDFEISCENNVEPGVATVKVKGIGNYTGEAYLYFTILPVKDMKQMTVTLSNDTFTYTGDEIKPRVTVYDGDERLVKDVDYSVSYSNNKSVGTGVVTVTGLNQYTGTKTLTFQIEKVDLGDVDVDLNQTVFAYTGAEIKPTVIAYNGTKKLTVNKDYTVSYNDNIQVGQGSVTVTGIGNYTGFVVKTFTIEAVIETTLDLTDEERFYIDLLYEEDIKIAYAGKPIEPIIFVYDMEEDKVLEEDIDYTVDYQDNNAPGVATILVNGTEDYTGQVAVYFQITKGKSKLTLKNKSANYSGSAISIGAAKVTGSGATVKYTYYLNSSCTKKTGTSVSAGGASASGKAPKVAGKYYVKATVASDKYYGSATSNVATLTINKISQTFKVTPDVKKVKYGVETTYKLSAGAAEKATVTYQKSSGSSYIKIDKTGKVTVGKKLKRGTYKVKVNVTAAETTNYKKTTKTVTITVVVK